MKFEFRLHVALLWFVGIAIGGMLIIVVVRGIGETLKPMTNDQIIIETKKCKDAGLTATHYVSGLTFETVKIQCGNAS